MDIKPRQPRDMRRPRSQFQPSYYYMPSRPSQNTNFTPQQKAAPPVLAPKAPVQDFRPPAPQPTPRQAAPAPTRIQAPPTPQPVAKERYDDYDDFVDQQFNMSRDESAPAPRKSVLPVIVMMVLILGVVGIGAKLFHGKGNDADAQTQNSSAPQVQGVSTTQTPKTQTTQKPAVALATDDEMAAAINGVIDSNKGAVQTSVAIIDLKTGKQYQYGVDAAYLAASTGKVITALDYLKQVENGSETLDKTIGGSKASDLLTKMIELSDNDAWAALNGELTLPQLTTFASSIGANYDASKNTMKAMDLAKVEADFYQGKILNDTDKKLLLGHMKNANKTDFFLAALPGDNGINIYHKAGWLDDRSHDSAIIDNGTNPYVLVVYTKSTDSTQTDQRVDVLHKIANATVARFISKDSAAKLAQ